MNNIWKQVWNFKSYIVLSYTPLFLHWIGDITPLLHYRTQKTWKQGRSEQNPMWVYWFYFCYTKINRRNRVQVVTSGMQINRNYMNTFNSLAPGGFKWNFGWVIFKLKLVTDGWVISCDIPLSWMSLKLIDDKLTLVQVMAWFRQATSHYLNQCWPRYMSPYGVTKPQWVKCYVKTGVMKVSIEILYLYISR